jgi:hypothetical protein
MENPNKKYKGEGVINTNEDNEQFNLPLEIDYRVLVYADIVTLINYKHTSFAMDYKYIAKKFLKTQNFEYDLDILKENVKSIGKEIDWWRVIVCAHAARKQYNVPSTTFSLIENKTIIGSFNFIPPVALQIWELDKPSLFYYETPGYRIPNFYGGINIDDDTIISFDNGTPFFNMCYYILTSSDDYYFVANDLLLDLADAANKTYRVRSAIIGKDYTTTTERLAEIEKMKSILENDNYSILYDSKDYSNNVLFKKEQWQLVIRFQQDYPFYNNEFYHFRSLTHNRVIVPWEYFELIFHTLWFKFHYRATHDEHYLFNPKVQNIFALNYFVNMIWEKQSFQNMRRENSSSILVIYQPQGDKSKVFVYLDAPLSEKSMNFIKQNIKIKFFNNNTTMRMKPSKEQVELLGKILINFFNYKF